MQKNRLLRHTKAALVIGGVCAVNLWFVSQVTGQTYATDDPRGMMDYTSGSVTTTTTSGDTMGGDTTSGGTTSGGRY